MAIYLKNAKHWYGKLDSQITLNMQIWYLIQIFF